MNKKRLVMLLGVSFVIAMMMGLMSWGMLSAQECRVIRVMGKAEQQPLTIEPATTFVNKGDCVVWFNRTFANEIQVMFKEGKKCLDVTKSPQGFSLNAESCYVTSWIPFAGTSSLRFMEKGTYKYEVKAKSMPVKTVVEGQIVVE